MIRRILVIGFPLTILLLLTVHAVRSDNVRGATADTADLVRAAYDGGRAFETVAFLDQYIRWPGNRGFDAGIDHVAARLESAGFLREEIATAGARLTYRIEEYPMVQPAWEPLAASVAIQGQDTPILDFASNRNMLAVGSFSTPAGGITVELVDVGTGTPAELDAAEVKGKIVLAEGRISELVKEAVVFRGAIGVLAYSLPGYLKPQVNKHSIQFRNIEDDIGVLFDRSVMRALPRFVRGDCNDDAVIEISDGVCILNWLFRSAGEPACVAATNTNGDAALNISDVIYLLNHLFRGGPPPAPPYYACGPGLLDTDAALPCDRAAELCR